MDTYWIHTSAALPVNGQAVEFLLDTRECPIAGIYSDGRFRSRWTRYAPEVVYKWRGAIGAVESRQDAVAERA